MSLRGQASIQLDFFVSYSVKNPIAGKKNYDTSHLHGEINRTVPFSKGSVVQRSSLLLQSENLCRLKV
jgi:hypothetical protein